MQKQIFRSVIHLASAALLALAVAQAAAAQPVEATVGSGPDGATIAIEFEDGALFFFEVFFDEATPLSGLDAMLLLESELPSLSLVLIDFGFGLLIDGIAYDGHSNEGFGGGELFWHYWNRPSDLASWEFAAVGAADRLLADGDWDGWVYGSALPPRDPVLSVPIDIRPGNEPNAINPFSNGVIPVAVLGSDDLEATDVEPASLAFGPAGAMVDPQPSTRLEDVDGDGRVDLVAHFRNAETGIALDATDACLSGRTRDGTDFAGCDGVRVVVACGLGFELALLLPPLFALRRRVRRSRAIEPRSRWDHSSPVSGA